MSALNQHANGLGDDLIAPLTTATVGTPIVRPGQVVTGTPATAVAVGAGVTAAAGAATAGYAAEEAADG